MSNIDHRAVGNFFTRKGLNTTEISTELNNVYKDFAPLYRTVAKWMAQFKNPKRGFEDALRMSRPSTITIDKNIEAVEWIVMHDWQVSVRRVAYELGIPKTTVHEIMDNQLGMEKVWTRWVPKLLTLIQRANHVDCCQELVQETEANRANSFDCFVTCDEL